jgi:Helix-turn-helix domain
MADMPRRDVTDPRAMRALAHPLRLQLLTLLTREGTLTSTRAAELTGESTGSCSFHLRQLAKYGYIEPAPGGRGRERPWKPVLADLHWSAVQPDAEGEAAANELVRQMINRDLADLQDHMAKADAEPPEWREAAQLSSGMLFLTREELEQFGEDYLALVTRYADRMDDPSLRPPGSRPVRRLAFAVPLADSEEVA